MRCLIIFIVVWFFVRKRAKHRGDVTLTYLMMYGFERMLIESLRTDSLMIGKVRVSQALSAVLFFGILIFFIVRAVYEKKHNVIIWDNSEIYYGDTPEKAGETDKTDAPDEEAEQTDPSEPDSEPEPVQEAPAEQTEPKAEEAPAEPSPEDGGEEGNSES